MTPSPATRRRQLPAGLARALLACLTARALTFVLVWSLRFQDEKYSVVDVVSRWDASWYIRIARSGYPDGTIDTTLEPVLRFAFFPLWPLVMRQSDAVGLSRPYWGLLVVTVCSVAFTALLWKLVADWRGPDDATWVATLAAFVPGSYVFGFLYSEPLFLVGVVAFFVLVRHEQWVGAGVVAAVAGLGRPNGTALIAAAAWIAWRRWRGSRDYRPLVTLALAPLGFLSYVVFVWMRTDEPTGYLKVQRDGWGTGLDWGRTLVVDRLLRAVASPTYDWNAVVTAITVVVAVAGFVLLVRLRPPGEWVVYAAVVLGLAFFNQNPTSSPRFTYTAFPVVVALALTVPRRWRWPVLAGSAAVSLWFMYVLATTMTIAP